ncbi:Lysine/arginine permease [Spathaspora sp. JA1]|nr:Lysine/arginine permease [Spathaspora sp. JA1]
MSTDFEKYAGSSSAEPHHRDVHPAGSSTDSKGEKQSSFVAASDIEPVDDVKGEIKRNLKPRHVSMIALGGTIGTGLFISTGGVIAAAGPVSSLFSFLFMTTLAFSVTQSLGEMATLIPVSGSFLQFVTRWCSPALGAANGWNYWFSWAITFALELSIVGQVIEYWTDAVPLAAWISIFFVLLTVFNLFPVKYYGEVEFWVASIKVLAVFGWIIYAFIMVCGAGKTGPVGFRYWRNPGPWGPGILVSNKNTAQFLGWLSSLISAAFTFQGTELVGISAGEAANPRKSVPSAIRKVLFRILVFYVLCILFLGLLVPYDDPVLSDEDGSYTHTSPFIIAMNNSGTKVLPDIFNAVILSTIISAANSNIYSGSRILYGLAQSGVAPKFFTITNKFGVPYIAVLFTSAFGALGYLACSTNGNNAFDWLLNISACAGLIAWGWISFTHIRFMNVLRSRNISRDSLPFKAKFMPWGAYYASITIFIVTFVQGFSAFWDITPAGFFTAYVSLILFVFSWAFFHVLFNGVGRSSWRWRNIFIPLEECDIDSGVREVSELEYEEEAPKNLWQKFWAAVA